MLQHTDSNFHVHKFIKSLYRLYGTEHRSYGLEIACTNCLSNQFATRVRMIQTDFLLYISIILYKISTASSYGSYKSSDIPCRIVRNKICTQKIVFFLDFVVIWPVGHRLFSRHSVVNHIDRQFENIFAGQVHLTVKLSEISPLFV